MTIAPADRAAWYPAAPSSAVTEGHATPTVLLGEGVALFRTDGVAAATGADRRALAVTERYDHVWVCPGTPDRALFAIPEAAMPGRRAVPCGSIHVRCSPLRAVENFLDIAHFPFIHTGILGEEPHTEVNRYDVRIDDDLDEVWARNITFHQPQASVSAEGALDVRYEYRVPAPTTAILYKTCPARPAEWDVIAIFVQPVSEETCIAHPWMTMFDDATPHADMVAFQQTIFLQDRSILENQIPARLPLDPGMEVPTQADLTSIAYRRWLKRRGHAHGAQLVAA
ncbi:aromatic ring-hydroxylating dioxygenase subunit alpha [Jannaschia sp. LMIT008]|uniref:aromatic ring-hydroxylating dioxygenase subunit alpha n=1 Tax=Jannaschia maritima TaxID=3032585 RepID=UPI0028122E6D|nr:aromatic ring-hydroxylating dioxygenase subunit alpha [Jannaschia sp. LMIT008]